MERKQLALSCALAAFFASSVADSAPKYGPGTWGRVLVDGPKTHAAAGIKFDPRGDLWIACILDHTMRRIDRHSGRILEEITYAEGVRTPDDLTFGSDGTLYFTNFLSGEVSKRPQNGPVQVIANLGEGVNGITIFPDGRLFVSKFLVGDELFEVDTAGTAPPRLVASGLFGIEGLDAGPDGAIYASMFFDGTVVRIERDSGAVSTYVSGLEEPIAQRFAPNGDLYILEYRSGRIMKRRASSPVVVEFARTDAGVDGLDFDPRGTLYTSNWASGRIEKVSSNGRRHTIIAGGSVAPGGLAVQDFAVYSAEVSHVRAHGLLFGTERAVWPTVFGDPSTGVALPFTIATSGDDMLTTSWFTNTVQIVDAKNGHVRDAMVDFSVPMNAIRYRDGIVVAEAGTGHLVSVRCDPTCSTGPRRVLASGFALPTGLATDGESLWASDWANGSVSLVIDRGVELASPVVVASELALPEGLAVDGRGTLYIYETARNRIVALSRSGVRTVIASRLDDDIEADENFLPTWIFCGLAVDRLGLLYASVPRRGQILQMGPAL